MCLLKISTKECSTIFVELQILFPCLIVFFKRLQANREEYSVCPWMFKKRKRLVYFCYHKHGVFDGITLHALLYYAHIVKVVMVVALDDHVRQSLCAHYRFHDIPHCIHGLDSLIYSSVLCIVIIIIIFIMIIILLILLIMILMIIIKVTFV